MPKLRRETASRLTCAVDLGAVLQYKEMEGNARTGCGATKPPELQVNPEKQGQFMGQVVGELGAAMNAALVLIGEKLGLYKAMAGAGPMTASDVARKTNADERYVREWLAA